MILLRKVLGLFDAFAGRLLKDCLCQVTCTAPYTSFLPRPARKKLNVTRTKAKE